MQTAKPLLILLALGLCVSSFSQTKPDTEAQAKAREALRKKIAELEGQPAAPADKPAKPAKPAAPTAAFVEAPAAATGTPEEIERLREATRRKIAELNAQGKTAPGVAAAPAPPADSTADRRAQEKAAAAEKRRLADETTAREQAAAEAAKARAKAEADEAKARAAQEKAAAKAKPALKPVSAAFDPVPVPPSAIPSSKEERLAELLTKYKADEITPQEYHLTRAKILAEP